VSADHAAGAVRGGDGARGADEARTLVRGTSLVAFANLLSRGLGFVRDVLFAQVLGGGAVMTAWTLAFTIANMLRRIVGEGALGTALVPIFTGTLAKGGTRTARRHLAAVLTVTGGVLAVACVVVAVAAWLAVPHATVERVRLACQVTPILVPYMFFVCLVGVMAAVLGCVGRFFLPALGTTLINVALIACLLLVCPPLADDPFAQLRALSQAVVLAGMAQLVLMAYMLMRVELMPLRAFLHPGLLRDPVLRDVWRLVLPGVLGASVLQVSMLTDKWLACWLHDQAVPALYYSDRLIYMPVGVFAVSMSTVILPGLSRFAARHDLPGMVTQLLFGLRQILFLCIPTAVFTVWFRWEIIRLFFMRGRFGEEALAATAWAMLFYAAGIPFFAAVKVLVGGFHARRDMRTPVRIAIACVLLNVVLNLILMWPLQQGGIALATAVSSMVNCVLLAVLLRRDLGQVPFRQVGLSAMRILAASGGGIACAAWGGRIVSLPRLAALPPDLLPLLLAGLLFAAGFLGAMVALRGREPYEWLFIVIHGRGFDVCR
jgi:putative peptidoglycan lipid II flippase